MKKLIPAVLIAAAAAVAGFSGAAPAPQPAPSSVTTGRWARQIHARKVHSYLWIFETGGYKRRG